MTKCKLVMDKEPECGNSYCCYECPNRTDCKDTIKCDQYDQDESEKAECAYRFDETENPVAIIKRDAGKLISQIAELTLRKKQIENQEKEMREQLKTVMEKYGVIGFDCDEVKFTYVKAGVKHSIDSTKLKKELPDVYAEYTKESSVKAYVKVEVKKK